VIIASPIFTVFEFTVVVVPLTVKLPGITTVDVAAARVKSLAPIEAPIVLSPATKSKPSKPAILVSLAPNLILEEPTVIKSAANLAVSIAPSLNPRVIVPLDVIGEPDTVIPSLPEAATEVTVPTVLDVPAPIKDLISAALTPEANVGVPPPEKIPGSAKVTVPVRVKPLTDPAPLTEVTVPVLFVNGKAATVK